MRGFFCPSFAALQQYNIVILRLDFLPRFFASVFCLDFLPDDSSVRPSGRAEVVGGRWRSLWPDDSSVRPSGRAEVVGGRCAL